MKSITRITTLVLSATLLPFATAAAQEGLSAIEEITVTARKRDESLI